MNRRGQINWYLIMGLIMGIIIIAIVGIWIFQEYIFRGNSDWETCRQSIVLRNMMPEKDYVFGSVSLKQFPLACKTEVVNIDSGNKQDAEKTFADTLASCYSLTGNGQYNIFPAMASADWRVWKDELVSCLICARVHISPELNGLDFKEALDMSMNGKSYWSYLNPGGKSNAFNYLKDWSTSFWTEKEIGKFSASVDPAMYKSFHFPRYYNSSKGDVYIIYAEPARYSSTLGTNTRAVMPYLIFLQEKDLANLNNVWVNYEVWDPLKVCTRIESQPA